MTTPAEKDAMALAGLAHVAENMVPLATKKDVQVRLDRAERFASNIRTHSAHLAARVAELEFKLSEMDQAYLTEWKHGQEQQERATRAEAELAAVRADAERYRWLRYEQDAIDLYALTCEPRCEWDHMIDAARGAG